MSLDVVQLLAVLALANSVGARTGLTFAPYGRAEVAARIQRAMRRDRIDDVREYLVRLHRDPVALDALLLELTVGETYFFRDRGQFDLLRDEVVPKIARDHEDVLRIWSAGCATGEEPYSIAILLSQLGLAERACIRATDLCHARLALAGRGRYGRWSLRDTPEAVQRAYFTPVGDRAELRAEVRERVSFRTHNLADPDDPTPWQHEADLVVCRNVLIYLRREMIPVVAHRLLGALRPGGWLLLGAADPFIGDDVACDVVTTDVGLLYRRPLAPTAQRSVGDTAFVPAAVPPPDARADAQDTSATASVMRVRAFARRGELAEAGRACAAALERHGADPALHSLQAFLLGASGQHAAAASAARRALYLDRLSPLGHLALADARAALGDDRGARAALRHAERLLAAAPAADPIPALDADTAGELLGRVRVWLAVRE